MAHTKLARLSPANQERALRWLELQTYRQLNPRAYYHEIKTNALDGVIVTCALLMWGVATGLHWTDLVLNWCATLPAPIALALLAYFSYCFFIGPLVLIRGIYRRISVMSSLLAA